MTFPQDQTDMFLESVKDFAETCEPGPLLITAAAFIEALPGSDNWLRLSIALDRQLIFVGPQCMTTTTIHAEVVGFAGCLDEFVTKYPEIKPAGLIAFSPGFIFNVGSYLRGGFPQLMGSNRCRMRVFGTDQLDIHIEQGTLNAMGFTTTTPVPNLRAPMFQGQFGYATQMFDATLPGELEINFKRITELAQTEKTIDVAMMIGQWSPLYHSERCGLMTDKGLAIIEDVWLRDGMIAGVSGETTATTAKIPHQRPQTPSDHIENIIAAVEGLRFLMDADITVPSVLEHHSADALIAAAKDVRETMDECERRTASIIAPGEQVSIAGEPHLVDRFIVRFNDGFDEDLEAVFAAIGIPFENLPEAGAPVTLFLPNWLAEKFGWLECVGSVRIMRFDDLPTAARESRWQMTPGFADFASKHIAGSQRFIEYGACDMSLSTVINKKTGVAGVGVDSQFPDNLNVSGNLNAVRATFNEFRNSEETHDLIAGMPAVVSWPDASASAADLVPLLAEASKSIILGSHITSACGYPTLWLHLIDREILEVETFERKANVDLGICYGKGTRPEASFLLWDEIFGLVIPSMVLRKTEEMTSRALLWSPFQYGRMKDTLAKMRDYDAKITSGNRDEADIKPVLQALGLSVDVEALHAMMDAGIIQETGER